MMRVRVEGVTPQGFGQGARGEAFGVAEDEQHAELGERQAEAGPGLEAAGVGAHHDAAEEEEGLVEKFAIVEIVAWETNISGRQVV